MPTVSVLIPAYNVEKYLRRTLDSVINQTFQDFEVILFNDGATDRTPQICDEYAGKYSNFHVYHQKNVGLSKTRERLLEKVNGKYIFWLDSDDYYDQTLLEKAMKAFEQKNVDIVTWGHIQIQRTGLVRLNIVDVLGVDRWKKMTDWGLYPEVWSYASKKNIWKNFKSSSDEGLLIDDVWISSRIVPNANVIICLKEELYYHDGTNITSITNLDTPMYLFKCGISFYRILRKHLRDNPYEKPPTDIYIQKIRNWLVNAYCISRVDRSLKSSESDLIQSALKDLMALYPQKKNKKFYFIQICVINGIDFICRWYGKGRIKKLGLKRIG